MKNKRSLWTLVASLVMVLPFFLGFGGMPEAFADEKDTQTVTLHKLQFAEIPGEQQNTGDDNMEYSSSKPLAGAIFTAYDMTSVYWEEYDSTQGDDKAKTDAAQKAVMAEDITALGEGLDFPTTGENGEASRELPKKSLVGEKKRNAIYLIKETKAPAGVVSESSVPFILGLPVYNDENYTGSNGQANEEKNVVHVYPKNVVKPIDLSFVKYGVDETGTANVLANAAFVLKDATPKAPGEGNYYVEGDAEVIGDTTEPIFTGKTIDEGKKIPSDTNGKVSLEGLLLPEGTYEFYEVDSDVSTSEEQEPESEEIFHYGKNPMVTAKVDSKMNVTYTYYDIDGKTIDKSDTAEAYNYKVPTPTKEAGDHDVNVGQVIPFTIEQLIPKDIANYTQFDLVDTYDKGQLKLKDTVNQIKAAIKAAGFGSAFQYVESVDGKITIHFDPAKLKDFIGKTLSFEINMSVKAGVTLGDDIDNNITLDNNFHDESDKDSVKTWGKSFIKEDADSADALNGAEFVIKKGEEYLIQAEDGTVSWTTDKGKATKFVSGDVNGDGKYDAETDVNADGTFSVKGLAQTDEAGKLIDYELVETKAPEGYVLPNKSLTFNADNGVEEWHVTNKHKGSLPSTGGTGIIAFVAIGVVAVAGAVLYFTKGRRQIEG